jgi:hypothetical protein
MRCVELSRTVGRRIVLASARACEERDDEHVEHDDHGSGGGEINPDAHTVKHRCAVAGCRPPIG